MWQILHHRLSIIEDSLKRGDNCSSLCCFYDQYNEYTNHLVMEFHWVGTIWFASLMGVSFSTNVENPWSFRE